MLHTFHKGGIHPHEYKLTASQPVKDFGLPLEVVLPFSQHIGAPAQCCVEKGAHLLRGEIVARAGGFVSANVHTPISGTVKSIGKVQSAFGTPADALTIVASEEDHLSDLKLSEAPEPIRDQAMIDKLTHEEILSIIDQAGIVGLGGATFPTKVKLSPPPGCKAEILIVNGVECEPFLTNDHALMLERPVEILQGMRLLMRAVGVKRAVIGIENNKRDAIKAFLENVDAFAGIEVMPLKVKYPEGGEKQLIEAVIAKEVPSGGLPIAVGAIVQNVATVYAVWEAARYGTPLIERVLTVTGPSLERPGNYRVPIGTSLKEVIEFAGGVPEDTGKIILGGPMMGRTAATIDAPTTKGVSGILMLPQSLSARKQVSACIRCGRCVEACPMGLEPYLLAALSSLSRWDDAENEKVLNCIECGSCSFICPAARPLLDYIRLGKSRVSAIVKSRKQK